MNDPLIDGGTSGSASTATKHVGRTPLSALLPGSIRDDATVAASAASLDPIRRALAGGIPNILLWSRLDPAPGRLCPPLQRLAELGGGLKVLSEAELELLAWQLHVDFREAATTPEQLAAMVRSAIPWHRIKGTPASIRKALALFGYSVAIEEDGTGDWWATYQLGLPELAEMGDVRRIVEICKEMQPARCRLWRLYTDEFDRRPIILSEGPVLGDGWLSFHSGVSVEGPDGDIVVSFGAKRSFLCEAWVARDLAASFGTESLYAFLAPYLDRFTVGRSRLSEPMIRNNPFVIGALYSILWAERETIPRTWEGEWDERRWVDYTGFDRRLPRWRMRFRGFSRSQLVPAESELADTNSRLGATFAAVIDNPPRLGGFVLSDHDCRRRELRLHEMSIMVRGAETPVLDPLPPFMAGETGLAAAPAKAPPERAPLAILPDLALYGEPAARMPPETALPETLVLYTEQAARPAPLSRLTSLLAPGWTGVWTDAGRDWSTATILSIH